MIDDGMLWVPEFGLSLDSAMSDAFIVDNHGLGHEDGLRTPLHCVRVQSPESTVKNCTANAAPKPMIASGKRNQSIDPTLHIVFNWHRGLRGLQ